MGVGVGISKGYNQMDNRITLRQPGDTIVHPWDGQKLKHLMIPSVGHNVRKQDLLHMSRDSDLNSPGWGQISVLF